MERLNLFASKYIQHVKELSEKIPPNSRKGSSAHIPIIDFTDKITTDPIISKELNHDDSIAKIYKTIDGKKYGFDDSIYPSFLKFVSMIEANPSFKNKASKAFLLEETFSWVINSFITKKIQLELFTYLENRIEETSEIRTYHFPVLNLHIEECFQIGNASFQYFTKQYFDDYISENNDLQEKKEDNDKIFSRYYGQVVISCDAEAEPIKSEEIAFSKASLAMDIFRLFSPAVLIPLKIFKVDLERRININYSSGYLTELKKNKRSIQLNFEANNDPFYFDKQMLNSAIQNGLTIFSDFIKTTKADELYRLIKQSITFFSFALSITDLHLRISQLIMIVEGLLLEEEWINGMEKKSRLRLCKVLFQPNSKEYLTFNSDLISMYQIRHKFTHKGIRIPIDSLKLSILQSLLVEFLKKMIIINQQFKTKKSFIEHLEKL